MPGQCVHIKPVRAGVDGKAELSSCYATWNVGLNGASSTGWGNGSILLRACRSRSRRRNRRTQCEAIGANPFPFLDWHAVGFKELTNAHAPPARDFFKNRSHYGKRIRAEHRSFSDLRNVWRLRNRDGQAVACVHMQHDVNIGAAVANVNHMVRRDVTFCLQPVENGYFSVTSRRTNNALNFSRITVFELGAINVIRGHNAL